MKIAGAEARDQLFCGPEALSGSPLVQLDTFARSAKGRRWTAVVGHPRYPSDLTPPYAATGGAARGRGK